MKKHHRIQLQEIPVAADLISKQLKGGEILALMGPLGAGKTTFAQHLGKKLKVKQRMPSPTFTIMHNFPATIPISRKKITLYHLDLYRTKNFREVKALGITEIWGAPESITIIEWANKIKRYLPKKTIFLTLTRVD